MLKLHVVLSMNRQQTGNEGRKQHTGNPRHTATFCPSIRAPGRGGKIIWKALVVLASRMEAFKLKKCR